MLREEPWTIVSDEIGSLNQISGVFRYSKLAFILSNTYLCVRVNIVQVLHTNKYRSHFRIHSSQCPCCLIYLYIIITHNISLYIWDICFFNRPLKYYIKELSKKLLYIKQEIKTFTKKNYVVLVFKNSKQKKKKIRKTDLIMVRMPIIYFNTKLASEFLIEINLSKEKQ